MARRLGVTMYYVTWPGIWLILRWSNRTRVVIMYNDEILVVKPWLGNGKWCLPGGGIHANEGELTALEREVFEETGIELIKNRIQRVRSCEYRQDGLRFAYVLFTYSLSQKVKIISHTPEIAKIGWVKKSRLHQDNANNDIITALKYL